MGSRAKSVRYGAVPDPGGVSAIYPDRALSDATYAGYDTSLIENGSRAIRALKDWARSASEMTSRGEGSPETGLMLIGPTGVGKTHLLTATARYLSGLVGTGLSTEFRCLLVSEGGLNSHVREVWRRHGDWDRLRRAVSGVNRSWLFYDDFGSNVSDPAFVREITEIMMMRYASRFRTATVVTTNIDLDSIERVYGARLASRLYEMFRVVKLDGEDRRGPR